MKANLPVFRESCTFDWRIREEQHARESVGLVRKSFAQFERSTFMQSTSVHVQHYRTQGREHWARNISSKCHDHSMPITLWPAQLYTCWWSLATSKMPNVSSHKSRIRDISINGVMMNGYNLNDEPHKCLELFHRIKDQNIAENEVIPLAAVCACSHIGLRSFSRKVIDAIPPQSLENRHLQNALIDMWVSGIASEEVNAWTTICAFFACSRVKWATSTKRKRCFDRFLIPMWSPIMRWVRLGCRLFHWEVSFSVAVNAYGRNGMGADAIDVYRQMPANIRDEVSHICVMNACSHAGLVDEARTIFDAVGRKTEKIIGTMVCSS